ncbi:fructose-specific PTS transporter subunit EIIC [Streptomyces chrestomyceticus]|uniref:fructose-specific PTS transporter subunit EIIC n=1 Tax=Streptomyces chrestomyceticus TaxID=68185 RepID=UPI0033FD58E1
MTTSPADPPKGAGTGGQGLKLLAVTACPTGIAHTYMAAEKLTQAAESLGHAMKVETQGSIGAENVLSDNDVRHADGIIIAADKDVDPARFVGKRLLVVGVAEGIRHPEELIGRVLSAPVYGAESYGAGADGAGGDGTEGGGAGADGRGGARGGGGAGLGAGGRGGAGTGGGAGGRGTAGMRPGGGGGAEARSGRGGGAGTGGARGKERGLAYKALMNGVSYMIPFVVVGGLLLALSLAVGGEATPKGLVIPEGTFWAHVNDIGTIGFQLMVPVLSGYIAYAIGDRPALVPGMIGGWIANTGELYGSKAGAGFIGAIVTGFLAGYLVMWIKKVRVPRFVRPIMPIIVIPIVSTAVLGLFFIYVLGRPISWVFTHLTGWLSGMTGTSAIALGAVLGLMIAFDMGGPVNKTAFLFGTGLIATGNQTVMGMCAAAIPVMPLGQGLATLIRRRLYSGQERETGMASLFMGLFGISEGAIPFAAARPAQVIPANMLGGAVAGAVAGMAGVTDAVPHGGPIVAILGAVGGVPMFFVAVAAGSVVTALTTVALVDVAERRKGRAVTGEVGVAGVAGVARVAGVAGATGLAGGNGDIGGSESAGAASGTGSGTGAEPGTEAGPEPVLAGVGATGAALADGTVAAGATGGMAVGAAGVAAAERAVDESAVDESAVDGNGAAGKGAAERAAADGAGESTGDASAGAGNAGTASAGTASAGTASAGTASAGTGNAGTGNAGTASAEAGNGAAERAGAGGAAVGEARGGEAPDGGASAEVMTGGSASAAVTEAGAASRTEAGAGEGPGRTGKGGGSAGGTAERGTSEGGWPGADASAGSAPAGGTSAGSTPDGSTSAGSTPDGSTSAGSPLGADEGPDGEGPDGEGPEGEGPEGEGPEGERTDGEGPEGVVLSGYVTRETVKVRLAADGKEAAIREMAELAARTGKVRDVDELVRVALAREAQGTTGLGEEIAIPHAKTDAVTAPVVGFARSAEGIDWNSLDGTRAKLVFMISVPEAAAGDEHLRILALLSRKLMDADFRARLQSAPDVTAILRVLSEVG